VQLPLKDQRWSPQLGAVGEPAMDFELGPGDTLYLPRGWPHEAETSAEASLHVTVGLHPLTAVDVLRAAVAAAGEDIEMRRTTVPGNAAERVAAAIDPAALRRRFVMGRQPILEDQLTQVQALESLELSTPVERRATVIAELEDGTLYFEGKQVAFPPQAWGAVAWIHDTTAPFAATDLPGSLDGAGRLVLLRRLVREGYLRITMLSTGFASGGSGSSLSSA
jgi:hypothetical protein